jgi:hypothetical protein
MLIAVACAATGTLVGCGSSASSTSQKIATASGIPVPDAVRYAPQDASYFTEVDPDAPGAMKIGSLGDTALKFPIAIANDRGSSAVPVEVPGFDQALDTAALSVALITPTIKDWKVLQSGVKRRWYVWANQSANVTIFEIAHAAGVQRWLNAIGASKQRASGSFTVYHTSEGATVAVSQQTVLVGYGNDSATSGPIASALGAHSGELPSLASDPTFASALKLVDADTPTWEWFRGGTVARNGLAYNGTSPLPEAAIRALLGGGDVVEQTRWHNGYITARLTGTQKGAYASYGKPSAFSDFRESARAAVVAVNVSRASAALPPLLAAMSTQYPTVAQYSAEIANALGHGFSGTLDGLGLRVTVLPHQLLQAESFLQQFTGPTPSRHLVGGQLVANIRNGTVELADADITAARATGLTDALVAAASAPGEIQAAAYINFRAVARQRKAHLGEDYHRSWADRVDQLLIVAYPRSDQLPQVELTVGLRP